MKTLSILLFISLLFPLAKQSWGQVDDGPYVVHVSDTPPGYTMVIAGGGYNPRSVQIVVHYPGITPNDRDQLPILIKDLAKEYTGPPSAMPAIPPDFQTCTLKPFSATEHSIFVALPKSCNGKQFPLGGSALVYLKDENRLSNPFAVNRTAGWWLLKTVSRPGELNRIYGFNMRGDPFVKNYVFLKSATGGEPLELPLVPRHKEDGVSENYHIQFRIPANIAPGAYHLFAHNNSGGIYGFSQIFPLTITAEPAFPQRLFIATEHGAKGDSFTDDQPALQALVDLVGQQGGGIIYLPPGQYRLNRELRIHANSILRGAGRENTIIFYGDDPATKKNNRWLISATNYTGLEDLSIRISDPLDILVTYYKNNNESIYNTHITRCRFEGGSISVYSNINMEIGDNIFSNASLFIMNIDRGWIHGNEFSSGRLHGNPFGIWASENTTIEHNRVFNSNRGFTWQLHGNFGHYRNFIDTNVVEGTRMGQNAGETFLFEGAGFKWWGKPDKIQSNGFAINEEKWAPDSLAKAFAVVTSGRGLGQYVRIASNTSNQVTLERVWPILPSGEVSISVLQGVIENVLTNNREVDTDNSMMFYGAGAINNRIIRNRSENGLGISVWSSAEAKKDKLIPDYFNIFEENVLEDQGGFWLTQLGDLKQNTGVRNLNNIFRKNFLADTRRKRENQYYNIWDDIKSGIYRPIQAAFWLDIGRSYESDRTKNPIWIDTLIEHNYITRTDWGIQLGQISRGTIINKNVFFDVKQPIIDQGSDSMIFDNRIEK